MSKRRELLGQKFSKLLAIELMPDPKGRNRSFWKCRCDCGKEVVVWGCNLTNGNSKSCGCYRRPRSHGMTNTPEYAVWCAMLRRCRNPNTKDFVRYGARGIRVCERWLKFENFFADMGVRPSKDLSIERNNNEGNYEPGNCRWATRSEQMRNRRPFKHKKKRTCEKTKETGATANHNRD